MQQVVGEIAELYEKAHDEVKEHPEHFPKAKTVDDALKEFMEKVCFQVACLSKWKKQGFDRLRRDLFDHWIKLQENIDGGKVSLKYAKEYTNFPGPDK